MTWLTAATICAMALGLCATLVSVACAYFVRTSAPAALADYVKKLSADYENRMGVLQDTVTAHRRDYEGVQAAWSSYKTEIAGLLENMEGVDESVERRRRRMAASDARTARREEQEEPAKPDIDTMTPEQRGAYLGQLARQQGLT